jgi:hypothetical protein
MLYKIWNLAIHKYYVLKQSLAKPKELAKRIEGIEAAGQENW